MTVKIGYSKMSENFFIDLWDGDKYVVSVKVSEKVAENISRETGIKILQ